VTASKCKRDALLLTNKLVAQLISEKSSSSRIGANRPSESELHGTKLSEIRHLELSSCKLPEGNLENNDRESGYDVGTRYSNPLRAQV
jgi:hypothetical protein